MAKSRITDEQILAQIPAAEARARRSLRTKPHAETARYERKRRVLHVALTNGSAFSVPVDLVPELSTASDAALAEVRVGPAGIGLHWDDLDADLSVAGLARLVLGTHTLLRAAGSAGGQSRSSAKAEAARENGKKGGRPRKSGVLGLAASVSGALYPPRGTPSRANVPDERVFKTAAKLSHSVGRSTGLSGAARKRAK